MQHATGIQKNFENKGPFYYKPKCQNITVNKNASEIKKQVLAQHMRKTKLEKKQIKTRS